jgi:hypothetical protein
MADIKFRGYVNKPQTKTGANGSYTTFSVAEKVKDKKEAKGFRKVYYNVTVFGDTTAIPADSDYVSIEGWLKPREYETNGQKRTSLDVIAQKLEVAPPRDGGQAPVAAADAAPATEADPWDLNA